jgi:hypothetical protein
VFFLPALFGLSGNATAFDYLAAHVQAAEDSAALSGMLSTAQAIMAMLLEVNPLCTCQGAYVVALPFVGGSQ